MTELAIDIVSDVVCPWCYIGKRRLEAALAAREAGIASRHRLFAPTLLRSQVLAQLYVEVQRGDLSRTEAEPELGTASGRSRCWRGRASPAARASSQGR